MSRSKAVLGLLVAVLAILGLAPQQPPRLVERVEVSRVLVDARVVDGPGNPILGLGRDDFYVKIDGKTARVESVQWIAGDSNETNGGVLDSTSIRGAVSPPPDGRLIVLLFQKSLEKPRIVGLMRMLIELRKFLETLTPNDRVAVLSFDSHLKIWVDFTNDLRRVRPVLQRGILFERPGPVQAAPPPSLVAGLDPVRARRASTIEEALRLIGEALEPLPGSKSLVFVGHGFGELGLMGVSMVNRYEEARQALQTARVSVFSLDVTEADYHSLEAGLQIVANDTGGFFERTHILTERALSRLSGALAGHYVLFVEKPDLESGTHRIKVELTRATGTVMARNRFVD